MKCLRCPNEAQAEPTRTFCTDCLRILRRRDLKTVPVGTKVYTFRWTDPLKVGYIEAGSLGDALDKAMDLWCRPYHFKCVSSGHHHNASTVELNNQCWYNIVENASIGVKELK